MLVSCILTSYNRPRLVRQALKSLEQQTWRNFEVLVVDDSDSKILDIVKVLGEFKFPRIRIWPWCGECFGRKEGENRLAVQINRALREDVVNGDLVCYLPDDDFYHPDWFAKAVEFFAERPNALQGFGSLHYSTSMEMDYRTSGVRFFDHPIYEPKGTLDHGMVMHRRRTPPVLWPEEPEKRMEPDGYFFKELALEGPFLPIMNASAVVKRLHPKNLQRSMEGDLSGPRE